MPKKPTDSKIAAFREYRTIQNCASAIAIRAIGTPFEARAKQIATIAETMLCEFQTDPEATIDDLLDHDLTPLSLFIGHLTAAEF